MPNIENIKKNNFANRTISAQRNEVLYRDDIKTSFGYAITGITVSLLIAGIVYAVGKKLIA
jgi:hypothetical protein